MWWDAAVLLVAVAVGALTAAIISVVRPALPTRVPHQLTWAAAAAGAVAVGLADTAPTGWTGLDLVLRISFGAVAPLAATRAGNVPAVWLAVATVLTFLVADSPGALVAGVAAGALLALVAAGAATPPAWAITAAAAVGALAHADWPVATGASALAMAVVTSLVLLVGLARTDSPARGRIVVGLVAAGLVMVAGSVVGLLAALTASEDVERAVDLATDGIQELGDDDVRARTLLHDAAGAFGSAEETLTAWWARPALLVPGVAQQTRAVTTMASAGAELARTAAEASEDADLDSVRPVDGRVDLVALQALSEPLERSVTSLRRADQRLDGVSSPLLLSPVADRLETLRTEVADALASADLAAQAVDVAPAMLGADGPRRYFIAFQNSAESTANGGFMGNWAEIVADGGELTLTRSGRSRELTDGGPDPEGRRIEGEPEFVEVYGQSAARFWGNINFTPDHPTVSRIVAQLYPQSGGDELDGVIGLTPHGLARFLELTGPVQVEGYPEALTPENAARILLHDQYVLYGQADAADREDFLADTVRAAFDALTSGELAGPRVIAQELGPAVEARHLQLWSRHQAEQALFQRIGADGSATRPDGVDSFGVTTQNVNGNKIDWFTHRDLRYEADWDPETGEVETTLTVTIRNEAPATGLPASVIGWGGDESLGQRPVADGENYIWLTGYSSYPIGKVTVDGEPVGDLRYDELGHHAVRVYVSVASESEREVVIRARGVVDPSSRYVLRPLRQPTTNPDSLVVEVRTPVGWEGSAGGGAVDADGRSNAVTWEDALAERVLVLEVARPGASLTGLDRFRYGG
jgi:hypothetical protein